MTRDELRRLLNPEVQALMEKHVDDDPAAFALKHHNRSNLPVRAIAEQIACRRKASKKLPTLSYRILLLSRHDSLRWLLGNMICALSTSRSITLHRIEMTPTFPGRVFRVKESLLYKPKRFRQFLERSGITAASIQRRDFPLSPDRIRRMYALKEGVGQYLCIYCEREA